uniref:Uncharacterized protein n=1 Tax=Rhizophora mucronata TaxID=61149 RepID=A0A2P2QPY5_RHIMU
MIRFFKALKDETARLIDSTDSQVLGKGLGSFVELEFGQNMKG